MKTIPIVPKHYCSNKFTFLKVDLEKQLSFNCHAATPHRIDIAWLKQNPGQLFNLPVNIQERQQMLSGQRNSSCEQNCYPAEDRGEVSTRMLENNGILYTQTHTTPTHCDITLFSDCNMACSYCCKEYSSAWRKDLETNGPYQVDDYAGIDRFTLLPKDKLVSKISQTQKLSSDSTQLLLNEISAMTLERVAITGGEPFLNRHLIDVVKSVRHVPVVGIFSGLGVNPTRFKRIVSLLNQYCPEYWLSGENVSAFHEFNRNGCDWTTWKTNFDFLVANKSTIRIHATLSNLTVIGFTEFWQEFKDLVPIDITFAYYPVFMSTGNLDKQTRDQILNKLEKFNDPRLANLITTLSDAEHDDLHRRQMAQWLLQYTHRRNLDIGVLPKTFTEWLYK